MAIVDDDPAVLKALARLLSARSFVTRTYLSGPQFLVSLPDGVLDYLIVDLQMLEVNALELQDEFARRGIKIPTIIITAHDEAGMQERCMSTGAIAYLSKPVHGTTLLAAIDDAEELQDLIECHWPATGIKLLNKRILATDCLETNVTPVGNTDSSRNHRSCIPASSCAVMMPE